MYPFNQTLQSIDTRNDGLRRYASNKMIGSIHAAHGPPVECTKLLEYLPQLIYSVMQSSWDSPKPCITFRTRNEIGIRLVDAFYQRWDNLIDAEQEVSLGDKNKITHRIRVDGTYMYKWDKIVAAFRGTVQEPKNLQRRKVAFHIATTVKECMDYYGGTWQLRNGKSVKYEDLVLIRLTNVSEGSWQPLFAFYHGSPIA